MLIATTKGAIEESANKRSRTRGRTETLKATFITEGGNETWG